MPSASSERRADEVLAAEREHLRQSREFLELMRKDVLSLRAMGGDPVSEEYLKADLYRRAEALRDLPDTPLFFGRLDYQPGALGTGRRGARAGQRRRDLAAEHFHVGRRHVHDQHGTPVVIDWRAPVSRPFYRASQAEPMGLDRRRRFGFSGGELTAFEDERFGQPSRARRRHQPDPDRRDRAAAVRARCATSWPPSSRTRTTSSGPASSRPSACRARPAPGRPRSACTGWPTCCTPTPSGSAAAACWSSGRTRPSWPTSENVLPALGELDVAQLSVADLTAAVPVRGTDSERAARVKGDARMAAGAQQRAVGAARRAGRGDHAGARIAPLAGARLRDRRAGRRAAGQGSAVRDRPRHARAPDRARHPDPDGGGGGDLRRPDPRGRPADQAGAGRGRLRSGRRRTRSGWCSGCCPIRTCCTRGRRRARRRRAGRDRAGPTRPAGPARPAGARPTQC